MRKTLLLSILLLLLLVPCLAQTNSQNSTSTPQARKFDEFVFTYGNYKEYIARFAEALKNEPTAKGYIIAYNGRVFGQSSSWANYNINDIRYYLNDYKFSPKRIVTIEGGLKEKQDVELFIVPKGAAPPAPRPTLKPEEQIICPYMYDVSVPAIVFSNSNSPLTFSTSIINHAKNKPIFNWSVSASRIISGQGTSSITVERPISGYQPISATVELDGFPSECSLEKKFATSPEKLSSLPLKIDEYEEASCDDESLRVHYLGSVLYSEPKAQAYVIIYGGKNGTHNEVKARMARVNSYVRFLRISPKDISIIDGGFREKLSIEFWLYEKGENPPIPTPTVEAKDVKLKGFTKISKYPCGY
jgi:hypothetical protein